MGNEKAIQCDVCDLWYHAGCENIASEVYKVLKKETNGLYWYCKGCNKGVVKILKQMSVVQQRQDKMEVSLQKLEEEMDDTKHKTESNEAEVIMMKKTLEEVTREIVLLKESSERAAVEINNIRKDAEVEKQVEMLSNALMQDGQWSDAVKKEVKTEIDAVTGDLQSMRKLVSETRNLAEETNDKLKRRNNVIIYRAAESVSSTYDGRLQDDKAFVAKLLRVVTGETTVEGEIGKLFRLGKKDQGSQTGGKVRPLLVEFMNGMTKNLVMQNLKRLRESEECFRNVVIAHDMTQAEREECRKKVEEAKSLEAQDQSGEWIYRVRGSPSDLRIVKWKKYLIYYIQMLTVY